MLYYQEMQFDLQIFIPILSALFGALIGASASIITIIVQTEAQNKRERMRIVTELARQEYTSQLDLAYKTNNFDRFPPLVHYLHYHLGLMKLLEKENLSPETLTRLGKESDDIMGMLSSGGVEHQNLKSTSTTSASNG